jgi:pimeloyl-ACP methyl ester carboxylesterase
VSGLNFRIDGPAGAPVLVLLHGLCESMRAWDLAAPLLTGGHRVMRVDLFGFGDSPQPSLGFTIEEQARGVAELLGTQTQGISDAMLVGHSMGGSVAVAERDRALARALVLVNAPPSPESRTLLRAERALRTVAFGEAAWRLMRDRERRAGLASAFAPGFSVPDVFVEDLKRTSHAAFAATSFALERFLAERPLADRVAALALPTTVIFGMLDQRVDSASLAGFEGLSEVRVEQLPDAGHSPMWEQPERTAELIARASLR